MAHSPASRGCEEVSSIEMCRVPPLPYVPQTRTIQTVRPAHTQNRKMNALVIGNELLASLAFDFHSLFELNHPVFENAIEEVGDLQRKDGPEGQHQDVLDGALPSGPNSLSSVFINVHLNAHHRRSSTN